MTIYMTKVWGHNPKKAFPLQFSYPKARNSAIEMLERGDRVILVATGGKEVDPSQRGRVLGMVEPTNECAWWEDFDDLPTRPEHFREDGAYRWPYVLLIKKAWKFKNAPKFRDISDRFINYEGVLDIAPLKEEESRKISLLEKEPMPFWTRSGDVSEQKKANSKKTDTGKHRGPPPTMNGRIATPSKEDGEAYTYCLELIGAKRRAFKIGWSTNWESRQRMFNKYSMSELGGIRYEEWDKHRWDTAWGAYNMEKFILDSLNDKISRANGEVVADVSYKRMKKVWDEAIKHTNRR